MATFWGCLILRMNEKRNLFGRLFVRENLKRGREEGDWEGEILQICKREEKMPVKLV